MISISWKRSIEAFVNCCYGIFQQLYFSKLYKEVPKFLTETVLVYGIQFDRDQGKFSPFNYKYLG
ncbi:hypothetical protein E4413_05010 [Leptospira interrogans]|nr:hypothetical protein E4412_13680 [Leptospira interrogans]QCO40346.1 hypothetical protein E4413_05010 [Leptospira interrogans]